MPAPAAAGAGTTIVVLVWGFQPPRVSVPPASLQSQTGPAHRPLPARPKSGRCLISPEWQQSASETIRAGQDSGQLCATSPTRPETIRQPWKYATLSFCRAPIVDVLPGVKEGPWAPWSGGRDGRP